MIERRTSGKSIISIIPNILSITMKIRKKGLYYYTNINLIVPFSPILCYKRHFTVVESSDLHTIVILRIFKFDPPTDLSFIYIKRSWKFGKQLISQQQIHATSIHEEKNERSVSQVHTLRKLSWIYFLSVIFNFNLCICLFSKQLVNTILYY